MDGVHGAEDDGAGLLVADGDAEAALELEHQFEHVDRVEAEPLLGEERRVVADLVGRDREAQAAHDRLLDLGFQNVRSVSHERGWISAEGAVGGVAAPAGAMVYNRPPSTPITWPVM